MFALRTLGTLDLRCGEDGRRVASVLAQPKRAALLVYLALAGARGRARDSLLAMFWPELPQSSARHALNQALHVLRGSLVENALLSIGEQVVLAAEVVRCDTAAFEQALDQGRADEALELYRGEFLEGFHLDDAPAFERWLDGERERLGRHALEGALALAEREQQAGNPTGAARWLDRARKLAPYDEQVLARTLRALATAGDRSGAVREYTAFARRLWEDLELEPSPELESAVEALRNGDSTPPGTALPPGVNDASPVVANALEGVRGERTLAGEWADRYASPAVPQAPAPAPSTLQMQRRRVPLLAAAVLAVLLGLGALGYVISGLPPRAATPPLEMTRVLVANFEVVPENPALHPLARLTADWVAQRLAQAGMVTVIPAATELHRLAVQAPPGAPNGSAAPLLAQRSRAGTIVTGSILVRGDTLLLQARITNTATGELLRAVGPVAAAAADPAAASEPLAQQVIGALATLLDSRLASWASTASQPPSLQAYRAYADALDRFFASDYPASHREAAELLRQAAAIDTTFTAPLLWAGFAYMYSGQITRRDSLTQALERVRDRLPPWDRAVLDFHRAHLRANGEGEPATEGQIVRVRSYEAAHRVAELTPGSEWQYLVGQYGLRLNRPQEALEALERADPQRGWLRHWPAYWEQLARARHRLGHHEAELKDSRRAQALHPLDPLLPLAELRALVALGQLQRALARADELLTAAEPRISSVDLFWVLAVELRSHGHRAESRRVAERAAAWALSRTVDNGVSSHERFQLAEIERFQLAEMLFLAERHTEAREILTRLVSEAPQHVSPLGLLGVIAAMEGDRDTARSVGERLAALGVADGLQTLWRAAIAAHMGDPDEAIALLRQALHQGLYVGIRLHQFVALEPLQGDPRFQALMRPQG